MGMFSRMSRGLTKCMSPILMFLSLPFLEVQHCKYVIDFMIENIYSQVEFQVDDEYLLP